MLITTFSESMQNEKAIIKGLKTYADIVNAEIQGACHLQFLE